MSLGIKNRMIGKKILGFKIYTYNNTSYGDIYLKFAYNRSGTSTSLNVTRCYSPDTITVTTGAVSFTDSNAWNVSGFTPNGSIIYVYFNGAVSFQANDVFEMRFKSTSNWAHFPVKEVKILVEDSNMKQHDELVIMNTFTEVVKDSPIPKIVLTSSNTGSIATVSATNMTKLTNQIYQYVYGIPSGNATFTLTNNGTEDLGNFVFDHSLHELL
jgi:hypothetical protein